MTQPIDRARRLLVLAERDITSFRALTSHPEVDISAPGFFAQQVVEKCLKAVAEYHGIVFRRTRGRAGRSAVATPGSNAISIRPIQRSQPFCGYLAL